MFHWKTVVVREASERFTCLLVTLFCALVSQTEYLNHLTPILEFMDFYF